jgi:rubrerythrin
VAETGHSKLYQEASEQLVQMKGLDGAVYYVCPTCGYTVTAAEYATFTKCPACFTKGSTFAKIM